MTISTYDNVPFTHDPYRAAPDRYRNFRYRRVGRCGAAVAATIPAENAAPALGRRGGSGRLPLRWLLRLLRGLGLLGHGGLVIDLDHRAVEGVDLHLLDARPAGHLDVEGVQQ